MLSFRYPDKPVDITPKLLSSLNEREWLCNAKYDGWRLQVYVDEAGQIRCYSRVGTPIQETGASFDSNIIQMLKTIGLSPGTVLDAEFVGPRGKLSPAVYIFDMLAADGQWLMNESYEKRWARCLNLNPRGIIHFAETVEHNFIELFNRLKNGWDQKSISLHEGIVIKKRSSKMKLSRTKSIDVDWMMRMKFRDIKAARY